MNESTKNSPSKGTNPESVKEYTLYYQNSLVTDCWVTIKATSPEEAASLFVCRSSDTESRVRREAAIEYGYDSIPDCSPDDDLYVFDGAGLAYSNPAFEKNPEKAAEITRTNILTLADALIVSDTAPLFSDLISRED
jgi:hypothetical protein